VRQHRTKSLLFIRAKSDSRVLEAEKLEIVRS
jgi:hypothetical protein